jgi:DNA-binding HxlR family transcriptional regulator
MRYSTHICARFQHGAEILGKRWTGLILHLLLTEGPQRFNAIADGLEVVSDRVLSERLKELEAEGIVRREVYPGDAGPRIEYHLTDKGAALARCWTNSATGPKPGSSWPRSLRRNQSRGGSRTAPHRRETVLLRGLTNLHRKANPATRSIRRW